MADMDKSNRASTLASTMSDMDKSNRAGRTSNIYMYETAVPVHIMHACNHNLPASVAVLLYSALPVAVLWRA